MSADTIVSKIVAFVIDRLPAFAHLSIVAEIVIVLSDLFPSGRHNALGGEIILGSADRMPAFIIAVAGCIHHSCRSIFPCSLDSCRADSQHQHTNYRPGNQFLFHNSFPFSRHKPQIPICCVMCALRTQIITILLHLIKILLNFNNNVNIFLRNKQNLIILENCAKNLNFYRKIVTGLIFFCFILPYFDRGRTSPTRKICSMG